MTSWAAGQFDFWGAELQGTKDLRTRCWLGYISSSFSFCSILSCSLYLLFRNLGGGGGCLSLFQVHFWGGHRLSLFQVQCLILGGRYGTTIQLLVAAIVRRILSLRNDHSIASDSYCSQNSRCCKLACYHIKTGPFGCMLASGHQL